jgi:superfamily II DNA or RNA helicase
MSYADFLASKRPNVAPAGIPDPPPVSDRLFPFQRDITRWALRRGRAAIWADCGLGKGWMALEWARIVAAETDEPVLILAPLAVAQQFKREGEKFGVPVNVCRSGDDAGDGVNVTNYDRLHRFDPGAFGGVVLDESSCLKDYSSATRNELIEAFARTPYRLACSATPAPNDHMELGNHAEFLGAMSRTEMLATFFCHDGGETQTWRLKGHARADFWRWLCSWAVSIRKPSDLGYEDEGYRLPPLNVHEHIVPVGAEYAKAAGTLFIDAASGLAAQRASRRSSLDARVQRCADLVNSTPGEPWLVWCDLNSESEGLTRAIPGAVEVKGSDDPEDKEAALADFIAGDARVLVTKPSIAGYGLNMQRCAHVAFVGLSNSFEAWYQAIRRTWRFGQTRPVECHLILSDADGSVRANLERKRLAAEEMATEMLAGMGDIQKSTVRMLERESDTYEPKARMRIPAWLTTEAA